MTKYGNSYLCYANKILNKAQQGKSKRQEETKYNQGRQEGEVDVKGIADTVQKEKDDKGGKQIVPIEKTKQKSGDGRRKDKGKFSEVELAQIACLI